MDHIIPNITNPMGVHWNQPPRISIVVDDVYATMVKSVFKLLSDYSTTIPSGVYAGKMWKCQDGDQWLLCWFDKHPTVANACIIYTRIILLQEMIDLLTSIPSE